MYLHRVALCFFMLLPAFAQAGIGGIGNAQVDEGKLTVSLRNAYIEDKENNAIDGRWRTRLMTDYGLDNDNAIGFYVQGDKRANDNLELEALIFEFRHEWNDTKTDGFYSGYRLRYTKRDGDKEADDAHIRLIIGAPYGKWDFRLNQIFGVEVGTESRNGLLVETRGQITREYYEGHRMGIENFTNFGNLRDLDGYEAHSTEVGPVFQGPITSTMNYEAGYRRGISDAAPEHTFRVFLIQTF